MPTKRQSEPSLRELQRWLAWKITHSSKKEPKPGCFPLVANLKPLSRGQRIEIYASSYILRIVEAMTTDFELTSRAVGEEFMHGLIQQYLDKHPSRFRHISGVGEKFSHFLKSNEVAKRIPFVVDLAQLDWLLVKSFSANDAPVLTREEISQLAPRLEKAVFRLVPSVGLMASHWNIQKVWENRDASDKRFFVTPKKERTHLLVWRNSHGDAQSQVVEGAAYKLLHLIRRGFPFGEILERMKDTPELESRLQSWFQEFMGKGLLMGGYDGHRASPV